MPAYGLPYRPWMRTATYCLFIAISVFSMALGFYDLIKNFPLLHRVGGLSHALNRSFQRSGSWVVAMS